MIRKLALLSVTAAALAGSAHAAVVVDNSVDAIALQPGFIASNQAAGQNFLVQFTLSQAATLTGADIYSAYAPFFSVGAGTTIKFRNDVGGAPATVNLYSIDSTVSQIDNDGSTSQPSIQRVHSDFAGILFAPGTYWFGMSGNPGEIGWNIEFNRPGSAGAWQLSGDNLSFSFGNNAAFAFRLTSDVPEPATWALMIVGMGFVGAAMRRRQTVSVTYA